MLVQRGNDVTVEEPMLDGFVTNGECSPVEYVKREGK
jgi:hypothetical protein